MISEGNNMFQQKVKAEAKAIQELLGFVPQKLEELRKEMESYLGFQKEEYEEWDEESQTNIQRVWHPNIDTSVFDEMLDVFYISIVGRIYSFAEYGLKELSGVSGKLKPPKGQQTPSDIDLYYQEIQNKKGVALPPIETLWSGKVEFHNMRRQVIHNGKCYLTETEKAGLSSNIDSILKMLLFVEEQIRNKSV